MLAGRRIQVWGFPFQGQVPDRMVPLTSDGGARETGHVLPSRDGLSARDLTVVHQGHLFRARFLLSTQPVT